MVPRTYVAAHNCHYSRSRESVVLSGLLGTHVPYVHTNVYTYTQNKINLKEFQWLGALALAEDLSLLPCTHMVTP